MRFPNLATSAFAIFIVLTWLVIALYPITAPRDHFGIGLLLGSLFGHFILASAWTVLGPGGWQRLPIAILWCCTSSLAWYLQTNIYQTYDPFFIILASAFAVALVVQAMLWPLRFWIGFRIVKPQDLRGKDSDLPVAKQFGIQHLMIVTTVVAVIVGGGRLLLPFVQYSLLVTGEVPVFVFLIVVACVLWVPLVFSVLAMRSALWPTIGVLVFEALTTYFEVSLLRQLGLARMGPDGIHMALINFFTILPILFATIALRMNGYRLQRYGHASQ